MNKKIGDCKLCYRKLEKTTSLPYASRSGDIIDFLEFFYALSDLKNFLISIFSKEEYIKKSRTKKNIKRYYLTCKNKDCMNYLQGVSMIEESVDIDSKE